MYEILEKEVLAPTIKKLKIKAPLIAEKTKPGNFIILRVDEKGERIPLTVADYDRETGIITIIFQEVGYSTKLLGSMDQGDQIKDIVGPLGHHIELEGYEKVVLLGGGSGTALLYPKVRAFYEQGAEVISITGARSKNLIILEEELEQYSDRLYIATDDGSYGHHGFVTEILKDILEKEDDIDLVIAIGPVPMMKAVADMTEDYGIKTIVSLNSIMVDGTGMCGACRITVGGERKFTCVDGPSFDAHQVDFEELMNRLNFYQDEEDIVGEAEAEIEETEEVEEEVEADAADSKKEEAIKEAEETENKAKNVKETKTPMREQPPEERINNFEEVPFGYNNEEAVIEAERCLQCKHQPCVDGCPVSVPIPQFIQAIKDGDVVEANQIIKSKNNLPAVCGRVCPQEEQCEDVCVMGIKNEPVAIGRLERYVADYNMERGTDKSSKEEIEKTKIPELEDKKVAVIGAGPAGLTAAADLAKYGLDVTIFEALHDTGGVLRYGIPEFRLPKDIVDQEVEAIKELGVDIQLNVVVGKSVTIDDLFEQGYESIFIGVGAGLPRFLNIPGENLNGVYTANEFLTRVNLMKAFKYPEYKTPVLVGDKVAVVGAGNVAMDSARTAKRLGSENVYIVYRRAEEQMPARSEEIHHAQEEGIEFKLLNNPVAIHGKDGRVDKMECQQMKLGEKDESGRRRPIPIEGSNWMLDLDTVIVAIGQNPNPLLTRNTDDLKTKSWGGIEVDGDQETSIEGVYAGGDVVTGAATVIKAMGAGKTAAENIKNYLLEKSKK
ncbi:MAG: NADPH-dependent glutamate synthase [Halanaerobium sp.]